MDFDVYVVSYCRADDKTRNFAVYGVYKSFQQARDEFGDSESNEFHHAIDGFNFITPSLPHRVYQSW